MDSFDYGKALSEMWTLGGKAFLEAQGQALRAMREGAAAMGLPAGMPGGCPRDARRGLPSWRCPAGCPARRCRGWRRRPPFRTSPSTPARSARRARRWPSSGARRASSGPRWRGGCRLARRGDAAAAATQAGAESTVAATLRRMIDPRVWLSAGDDMEEALQRMAQGPRFADLWDSERRFARVFGAWMALRRRSLEHQAVVLEGWTTAARRFAERLGERAAAQGEAAAPAPPARRARPLDRDREPDAARDAALGALPRFPGAAPEGEHRAAARAAGGGRALRPDVRPADPDRARRRPPHGHRVAARAPGDRAAAAAAAARRRRAAERRQQPATAAAMRASRPAARRGKKAEEN